MKSIKGKIIALVLSLVVLTSISIGIISYFSSKYVVVQDSTIIMNLLCENKMNDFNEMFKRIRQSAETLASTVKLAINDLEELKDDETKLKELAEMLLPLSLDSAENTGSVIAVYLRFDPSFSHPQSGFFYMKDTDMNTFIKQEPTDLSLYSQTDRERVAWFYETKAVGKAQWIEPYYNKNVNVEMISYVIPIYIEDEFFGVIGMDVNFDQLENIVSSTTVYDTGYAFLANDRSQIIYHQDLEHGTDLISYNHGEFKAMAAFLQNKKTNKDDLISYTYDGIRKEATFRILDNNMRFVLTAPKQEINFHANQLLGQMIMSILFIIMIAIGFTLLFAKKLSTPLLELNNAAKKIASGDLSVSITHQSDDEVGQLAESFRQTVVQLDQHFKDINDLAYKDGLSGVMNKLAYIEMEDRMNDAIKAGTAKFSLIVFDLDNLKIINDTQGHDVGDQFIVEESKIISLSFSNYPVYRIGGDEFAVLLENDETKEHARLLEEFERLINQKNRKNDSIPKLNISYGMTHFERDQDDYFNDVFKRADAAMYKHKNKTNK